MEQNNITHEQRANELKELCKNTSCESCRFFDTSLKGIHNCTIGTPAHWEIKVK